jgi:ribosomal protein L24E
MTLKKGWIVSFIIVVIVLLGFVWAIKKGASADRCDYDGTRIEPLYAVYFSLQDGSEKKFCSVVCASMSFSALKKQIKEVRVTDEPSGAKIISSQAFFVESEMVTVPHVKNRIHAFAKKEDALKHIQKFNGRWVGNPFHYSVR